MNNLKLTIIMIVCVSLITISFLSCDKDSSPTGPSGTGLVGTWQLTQMTYITPDTSFTFNASQLEQMGFSLKAILKSDSTYEVTEIDMEETDVETGTWSVSGNIITTVSSDNETEVVEFVLSGNKLTVTMMEEGYGFIQEFTRQ